MTLCSDKKTNERILGLDFTSAESVEGWTAIDDRVMGGVSQSRLGFHADGHAVFAGAVLLDNGGGFASVRHPELALGDASTVGYRLHVRGDGKRYKLNLRMDNDFDGVNHQAVFQPPAGRWVDIVLPLSMFSARLRGRPAPGSPTLKPDRVCQVGLMVGDAQAGPFSLDIKSLVCLAKG
jgi:NADH dehydrogenase [ubiquinone] 1 alpha subcomplex assembly factor 1